MSNNVKLILDYLREKKKALKIDEIAASLDLDSFLVEGIVNKLINELKVKEKGGKYIATDYHTGFLDVTKNGKCYVKYNNSKIWISSNKLHGALDGDTVLVDITNTNKDSYDGEVINIVERFKKNNVGTVVSKSGKFYIKADSENIYIDTNDDLILGEKVVYEKYNLIKDNIYSGTIKKKIGHIDDPKIDIYSKLAEFNVNPKFNDKVLKEVEKLPSKVSEDELYDRLDLRDEVIFTIDGDDSKDLDDAVSLKINEKGNYVLGVHIADVSHYVFYNSEIDAEAYIRGTSVYPPGAVIPMLPHELSSGICSLFSGVDRLTLSCIMEYDKNGKLVSYDIKPSVINSSKRMTYSKVNKVLEGNIPYGYEEYADTLNLMNKFKDVLRKDRFDNGSIDFEINKTKVEVDDKGRPINVYKEIRGEAEKLIEEFMLAANKTVAKDLSKFGESLYRDHPEPDVAKLTEATNTIRSLGIKVPRGESTKNSYVKKLLETVSNTKYSDLASEIILRSMAKAIYSKDNLGHYGLAFDKYTHFTSPIRRYPDLTIHRLIKLYHGFDNVVFPDDVKDYLNMVGIHTSLQERNADMCEAAISRIKMAEYIEENNSNLEGRIVKIGRDGMMIELYSGIMGTILFDSKATVTNTTAKTKTKLYKLGDTLEISLDFANKENGDIRFKEKVKTKSA